MGFLRHLAGLAFPIITVNRTCESPSRPSSCLWEIKTDAGLRTHSIQFHLGEAVDDVAMDGREVVSLFRMGSATSLVEDQREKLGGPNTTLVRNFHRDRMEVFMEV